MGMASGDKDLRRIMEGFDKLTSPEEEPPGNGAAQAAPAVAAEEPDVPNREIDGLEEEDGWEDEDDFAYEEYARKHRALLAQGRARARRVGRVVGAMLLWGALGFSVLVLVAGPLAGLLPVTQGTHPADAFLKRQYAGQLATLCAIVAVPFLSLLAWIFLGIRRRGDAAASPVDDGYPQARDEDAAEGDFRQEGDAAARKAFVWMLLLQLLAAAILLAALRTVPALQKTALDITLSNAGVRATYEGPLAVQYEDLGAGRYAVAKEGGLYKFRLGGETVYAGEDNYDGSLVLEDWYRVEYLPHTNTLYNLLDGEGRLLSGEGAQGIFSPPDGYWLHDGMAIRSQTGIYGYGLLSEGEQKAFDLFYGNYYVREVMENGGTRSFVLPIPLSDREYARVQEFYKSNTAWDGIPSFRYDTDSRGSIRKVYAGGYAGSSEGKSAAYQARGDDILSRMPPGLTQAEQCWYLAMYLMDHVRYETSTDPGRDVTPDNSITVLRTANENTTGYGALVNGYSNSVGIMQAFDMLARKSGISTIPVAGMAQGRAHAWNMVNLDGEWYHIDLSYMGSGGSVGDAYIPTDYAYFLADDAQIAATHQAGTYWSCDFIPLPKATSKAENWHLQNGLSFATAEEALAYLTAPNHSTGNILQLRMDDAGQRSLLVSLVEEGKAGPFNLFKGGGESPVLYFAHVDYLPRPTQSDFTRMRQEIPYDGPIEPDTDLSRLPKLYDGPETERLQRYINQLIGGQQVVNLWHYHREDYPEPTFILYAAARHTRPVAWAGDGGRLLPTAWDEGTQAAPYYPELAPMEGEALFGANEGILREHLEETARRLFGEETSVRHGSIPIVPLAGLGGDPLWEYDSLVGAYIRRAQQDSGYTDLLVMEYAENDSFYAVLVCEMSYSPTDQMYRAGYSGRETFAPGDVSGLREKAWEGDQPCFVVQLEKLPDGGLRLYSFGLNGRDYNDGYDGIVVR